MTAHAYAHEQTTADVVAGNIRAQAARLGFTQVALARALGMTQGSITRRWKGIILWQLDELDAVAEVLGVTVADLVTQQAPAVREGLHLARPEGLEPPTFWSVVTKQPVAPVIALAEYRAQLDELKAAS